MTRINEINLAKKSRCKTLLRAQKMMMPLNEVFCVAANLNGFIQNRLSFLFSRKKAKTRLATLIAFVKSHLTFESNVTSTGTLHCAPDSK